MGSVAINAELLQDLARHQAWADTAHWKAIHENSTLLEDLEIRKRLNHMVMALRMLTGLAQGETPDPSGMRDIEPTDQLEAALGKANVDLIEALNTIDLQKMIPLPRSARPVGSARRSATAAGDHAQSTSPRSERIKNAATGRHAADDGFRYLVRARAAVVRADFSRTDLAIPALASPLSPALGHIPKIAFRWICIAFLRPPSAELRSVRINEST